MITLYWSSRTRAIRMFWALEEVGQPYVLEPVSIGSSTRGDSPAFQAAGPLRKVPALTDGDIRVADSAAIALYLADRYAPGTLAPRIDDPARGEFPLLAVLHAIGDRTGHDREVRGSPSQSRRLSLGRFRQDAGGARNPAHNPRMDRRGSFHHGRFHDLGNARDHVQVRDPRSLARAFLLCGEMPCAPRRDPRAGEGGRSNRGAGALKPLILAALTTASRKILSPRFNPRPHILRAVDLPRRSAPPARSGSREARN